MAKMSVFTVLRSFDRSFGNSLVVVWCFLSHLDVVALEERISTKDERIKVLQEKLSTTEEKLQVSDISANETRTEFEGQQKLVHELQRRLEDAEYKVTVGEKLRKELHNTILELKGNIRVFCKVRPLLPDEARSTEGKVISYPTSMEAFGWGIELTQSVNFEFDPLYPGSSGVVSVDLSFNHLVGKIPTGTQLQSFPASSFEGNDGLYGPPLTEEQDGTEPGVLQEHQTTVSTIDWNFISVEVGLIFGHGMIFGPLLFWKQWRIWYWKVINKILCWIFPRLYFEYATKRGQTYATLRWQH
ncbi:hypothetical protein LR48_Vigan11g109000 [Vigna angularis]|uniref:Spindle pole body-associated protein Vik1/Cik1 microtubule binding domain-containing protein n=1 Tax=Phaseolus angularis TaxID=3914 RepID=A0A0L9VT77_PHAAN|nr:hypothetical protein LR48_Vigan11g109000 [Vigna angularis]